MTNSANTWTDNKLPSLDWLRGFFWSFEFDRVQETQKRIWETEEFDIEDTERYIAENSTDFIRAKLRDEAQCLKIIQWNQIRTFPRLQTNRTNIRGKSVPFMSDLYSAKSTITREELESYLNSYVRWQQHIKDEQKLLLLVMVLESWDTQLLERYCRDKNILWLLFLYPDFINAHWARENIFKRWFKQIDAIHNEEYPFDKTSLWGKYLHENFWGIQVVQKRLSVYSSETQTNIDSTRVDIERKIEFQDPWIQVFEKYLTKEILWELEGIHKEVQGLHILWTEGISNVYSSDMQSVILDIDKLCLLLIWERVDIFSEQAWEAHTTLYRLFASRASISPLDLSNSFHQYRDDRGKEKMHFSEHIFQTVIFSLLKSKIQGGFGASEIENYILILPLVAHKFLNTYDWANDFFTWWFEQLNGDMKSDIEDKDSDLWKYLQAHFFRIKVVEEKYKALEEESLNKAHVKENIPILSISEVQEIAKFYKIPDELLPKLISLSKSLKNFFNPSIDTIEESNPIASVYWNYKNIKRIKTNERADLWTTYMIWDQLSRESKQWVIGQLNPGWNMDAVDRGMMALILIKPWVIDITNAKRIAIASSAWLLLYPHFLNSISLEERNTFFTAFFEVNWNRDEIVTTDSSIWSILLKYFWDNKVVQSNHAKFNLAWNELNKAHILWSIDLEISRSKVLKLWSEPELEEWKTLHIVIYERSQKGNNFRNPIFYTQDDIVSWTVVLDWPRYSYKAFTHRQVEAFATQKDLPDEIKAADPVFLKREKKEDPIPKKGSWNSKWPPVEEPEETGKRNLDVFIPEDIEINKDRIILTFEAHADSDRKANTVEYIIWEDWSATLTSYFWEAEHEIDPEIDEMFRVAFEPDLAWELERRESVAAADQEERERVEKERAEQEKAREEVRRLEEEKLKAVRETQRAREDIMSWGGFWKILNDGLDFLHETETSSRFTKDASTLEWVAYWRLNPSSAIVGRITTLVEALWFVVSLDYNKKNILSHISLNSKEHWYADYSGEGFPAKLLDSDISPYWKEIADALVERIIWTLFKYNFTQDNKNKKKVAETSKKVAQRKELTKATYARLKKWQALAAILPITDEKTGEVLNVSWDARKDFWFVWISWSKNTRTLEEVKEAKLWILWKGWLLRAGGSQALISEDKSEENCNNVINHIRSDKSEFMVDYLFRRIFHTLEYFEEKVERSKTALKKPKIILWKDGFTRFHEDARKAIDGMRLKIDEDITPEAAKEICISVLEEFKKKGVLLAIVQPKVFSVRELAYSWNE